MGKLTIDISDELLKLFPSKKEAKSEARQAMVFDLVRRGKISKGKAAELLGNKSLGFARTSRPI